MSPQQIDALVDRLDAAAEDFIDMVWSGNEYTGEGSECPQIDRERLRSIIASQASPAPVPHEQAKPVGVVIWDAKFGCTAGQLFVDLPCGTQLYTRPVAAEKREPHTSEQRARPDRFVPSPDGRSIDDDDFIYDATLKVTGDFADDATRHSYARWICDRLNAGGTHPSTGEDA